VSPYSTLGKIYGLTIRLTEPVVEPCRRLLSRFNTGVLDFSVLLAFFLIQFVANALIQIII
jgi:YggT family protein